MKKILSLSALFAISVALFMATLGNGLVTSEVLAQKPGPACKSFENRNNPVKPDSFRGFDIYSEQCQIKGDTVCSYSVITEELAKEEGRPFLAMCANILQ